MLGSALGILISASMSGTVLAEPAGLFSVMPANHWSYAAVSQLAKNGLVEGFGGSVYRDDVILTRCEMAAITAKAMAKADKATPEEKVIIDNLAKEFAAELDINRTDNSRKVEQRLDKLEKGKPSIKLSGDARIRYQTNWNQGAKDKDNSSTTRLQQRVRLNFSSEIADHLTILGRLNATNESNKRVVANSYKTSKTNSPTFDRAELLWKNRQATTSFGRFIPSLGQGMIWDYNSIDGFFTTYDFGQGQVSAGYGDLSAYTGSGFTTNAFLANLRVKVAPNANLTIGHLNTMTTNDPYSAYFNQTAYGFQAKSGEMTITGEYIKNSDGELPAGAQDHGYWGRVLWKGINNNKPGTYGISLDYLHLGNYAVNSYWNPGLMVVSGGNGSGKDGAKGYGLGFQYVFVKNANFEARYYNLKPYDSNEADFSKYKPSYHLITNYRF